MSTGAIWAIGLAVTLAGPEPAELPTPHMLPPVMLVPAGVPAGAYRPSAYTIWQVTTPGMRGVWVPRVVEGPFGPVYAHTGQPYEFRVGRPDDVAPVILGTPYR